MKMKRNKKHGIGMLIFLLLILWISGCSNRSKIEGELQKTEQSEESTTVEDTSVHDAISLAEVMDRIFVNKGLDEALEYSDEIKDMSEDALVLLCTSESGKYKAYGCISPEYGMAGILLNNIIDGQDNWNYLEEAWSYDRVIPTLEEQNDYEVLFSFVQKNGSEKREIYFDTYDTGTMSARE